MSGWWSRLPASLEEGGILKRYGFIAIKLRHKHDVGIHIHREDAILAFGYVVIFGIIERGEVLERAAQTAEDWAAYLWLGKVRRGFRVTTEHGIYIAIARLYAGDAPVISGEESALVRTVEVETILTAAEEQGVESPFTAVQSGGLGINVGEKNLLFVGINQNLAADILAYQEYIEQLLVEAMEVELAVALLRSVDNIDVAAEHIAEFVYKQLHCGEDVLVYLNLEIIGVGGLPHKTVAYLDEERGVGGAQVAYAAFVAEEVFAEDFGGHLHERPEGMVDTLVAERRSQEGENLAEEPGVGVAVMLDNLWRVDKVESGQLELLEYGTVVHLDSLVGGRIILALDVERCSHIDVETRLGYRDNLHAGGVRGIEHEHQGNHDERFGMSAEAVASGHGMAVAEQILLQAFHTGVADCFQGIGEGEVESVGLHPLVNAIFGAYPFPAFHLACIYDAVGLDEVGENPGYRYFMGSQHNDCVFSC